MLQYRWIFFFSDMDDHLTLGSLSSLLGVTVFLCGIAIAVLGPLCHAPTVMLANFIATPIELR